RTASPNLSNHTLSDFTSRLRIHNTDFTITHGPPRADQPKCLFTVSIAVFTNSIRRLTSPISTFVEVRRLHRTRRSLLQRLALKWQYHRRCAKRLIGDR